MNKYSVKCITSLQLTVAEKTKTKNVVDHATSDVVTSQSLSRTKETCVRKPGPAIHKTKLNSVALVRGRTIPTERPPPVSEGSANFCG